MDFQGKNVLVIGAKRSGMGAIALLCKHGASVRAIDSQLPGAADLQKLDALGVTVTLQQDENVGHPDCIVLSPAVPFDLPFLVKARAQGIAVIGEVELASYFLKGPIIGITGSNGKTTTTALTGHLLECCGIPNQVGGNIGTAVTSLIDSSAEDQWNVLELSSFQLESTQKFRAHIAACLNLTPDHLDRHHTMAEYADAKARLFENPTAADYAVLNYNDAICRDFAGRTKAEVYWFSSTRTVPRGVCMDGDEIRLDGQPFLRRSKIRLRGVHNVENVMAASLIAKLAGAAVDAIAPAVETFRGVEHRIEFVRNLDGVDYYNDSKATNVDSTLKAVAAFDGPLWVILGGKDKGAGYAVLRQPLREKAKSLLLIGAEAPYPYAAAPLIRKEFEGLIPMVDSGTLRNAVSYARRHAAPGDTVLLSPACASFDQFDNYEQRGAAFKQLVKDLF